MSETPLTEEQAAKFAEDHGAGFDAVEAEFARSIERQLAEARARIVEVESEADTTACELADTLNSLNAETKLGDEYWQKIQALKSDLTACRAAIVEARPIISEITLGLQSVGNRTDEKLTRYFQQAYKLYVLFDVEGRSIPAPVEKPRMMKGCVIECSCGCSHGDDHEENHGCLHPGIDCPACTPVEPAPDVCRWVYDSRMGFHRTDKCGHQYKELMTDNKCPQCGLPVVVANAVPATTEPVYPHADDSPEHETLMRIDAATPEPVKTCGTCGKEVPRKCATLYGYNNGCKDWTPKGTV
jgi:rubredoxin